MLRCITAWIAAFFLFFFLSPSTQVDTMTPSNPLADGQTLVSAGGRFELGFFSPTDSKKRYLGIWHGDIPIPTVVWVANRESPILDSTGSLVLDVSGRLVVSAGRNSTVVWSSSMVMKIASPVAQLLDSGNLVVRGAAAEGGAGFAWQSFDYPTHTLLPGMKLGYDLVTGVNRSLSAWKNNADPSSAAYSLVLEPVETQIVLRGPSGQLWRSGPWNGLGFSGMPEMEGFNLTIVNRDEEVYFAYQSLDESIISNMVLQPSGAFTMRVWVGQTGTWNMFWAEPANQCDALAPCGPNGVCNALSSPICSCLQGFAPRVPANWALLDGTDGCVRRAALSCLSDDFLVLSNMQLPDTAGLRRDLIITFAECSAICVFNCSCYAYASAEIDSSGSGQGCMIWSSGLIGLQALSNGGQDLYLRLEGADLSQRQSGTRGTKKPIAIIIAPVTSGTLVLSLVGCIIWRKKRKTKDSMLNNYNDEITQEEDLDLPMLDLKTIIIATNNFSIKNKLGEGGFGPVYKGMLGDGQDIAVKRLSKSSIQGAREFKNEVILIARLQHRNLVRLLGCCIQGEEKILVYEYMPNKSLDSFLFDKTNGALAAWEIRYYIILGIARGLLYLHQDSRFRIIHRDLKASNILLDKVMNPKISDFGMARIFGGDENEASTRRVVGTYGYMAPEYIMEGIFSVKSDVFSFGVLLLEIITGKRNRGNEFSENHGNLLGYAWNFWREGSGLELVDRSMECSYPTTKVLRCINIGLLCVQERPEDRPTMSSVVLMLSSDDGALPPPKKPGFVVTGASSESCNPRKVLCSLNDVTLTVLDGRLQRIPYCSMGRIEGWI